MKDKVFLILRVQDEREDVDDIASESDEPELNSAIHDVLDKYLGAGDAKSDELCIEIDLKLGKATLLTEEDLDRNSMWSKS